jgi:hypothetical protein
MKINNMKFSLQLYVSTLILLVLFISCSNDLNLTPRDTATYGNLNPTTIPLIRNGVYATMEDVFYTYLVDFDKRGDNFIAGPANSLTDAPKMTTSDGDVNSLWDNAYSGVKTINVFLAAMDTVRATFPSSNFNTSKGEALFLRALIYFNLATRWGGVPIVSSVTYDKIQRSSEDDTWKFIKSDLTTARRLIGSYSSKYYASDMSVLALMAKVYLATGYIAQKNNDMTTAAADWAKAAAYADTVIVSNKFALSSSSTAFANNFAPVTGSEDIFVLANNTATNKHYLSKYSNDSGTSWAFSPNPTLWSGLYANATSPVTKSGDLRKSATFTTDITRCVRYPNTSAYDPIVLLRIAEMYLIKAEALGASAGGATLNVFMSKRYTTVPTAAALSALSAANYQTVILDEYHREFYNEGHWWYDVKRTNRTDLIPLINSSVSDGVPFYLLYYPIPQTEIDYNRYIQNPGY